jgi:hypothetical protein
MKDEGGRMKQMRRDWRARPSSSFILHPSSFRAAYSFPEVLFAVVVLGIGFIMIAGIFPVAISQSKATLDETVAAAVARGAVNALARIGDDQHIQIVGQPLLKVIMPETHPTVGPGAGLTIGDVMPFDTEDGWNAVRGSQIFAQDPRYAFVPLYRRDGNTTISPPVQLAGSAQIFVIIVQIRGVNDPRRVLEYGPAPVTGTSADLDLKIQGTTSIINPNNLYPRQIQVKTLTDNYQSTGVDIMELDPQAQPTGANQNLPDAVAEGTYVIMRQPHTATKRFYIYRVGLRRADLDSNSIAWELQPGNDMQDNQENITGPNAPAWVVGRERLASGEFVGPAQDIACFTTFIKANP